MRKVVAVVAVCLLLLPLVPAGAYEAAVSDQVQAACQRIDEKIQELEQLKQELLQQAGMAAPPPAPARHKWEETVRVTGFFQNRWESYETGQDQFTVRRMFISLLAKPTPRSSAVVTWARIGAGSTDANWANIFADYQLTDTETIRFGQGPTWFGLEGAQSSSARLPFERAAFVEGGGPRKPAGMLFRGPWDRGIWLIHTPQDCARQPQIILGAINGNFRDPANNNRLTYSVDLKMMPTWGQYGLSWLDGEWTGPDPAVGQDPPMVTFARNGLAAYLRYQSNPHWAAQTEYFMGRFGGHEVRGWYGHVEKPLDTTPGTLFARYEWYDPNVNAGSDAYKALVLGYAHQLDRSNRITLQWTGAERGSQSQDEAGVQWQFGF